MARNGLIISALTFFVVVNSFAEASLVLNFRKAIVESSSSTNLTQNSPIPSPVPGRKDSNSTADKHKKEKPKDSEGTKNNNTSTKTESTGNQTSKGQTGEGKEKIGSPKDSRLDSNGSCEGSIKNCSIPNTMVACILTSEKGSKQLSIQVKNLAERTLKVNYVGNALKPFEIPSHQTKKMNISLAEIKANTIVLRAENGDCAIHMAPPPGKNFFEELSFYSKQVTPIYGAYFSFFVVLVCGGVWACCKLRKRRWQGGAPYQELEMGLPESAAASAVDNVDSTEGWDQGWDDDWDDDKAVKSPGGNHVGSISANGLTSRSAKKDGWEVDWED